MKVITLKQFLLYNFIDNEEEIKEIKDWQFAEIQDNIGNRITQKIISDSTMKYRDKTKSEFYNKLAYNNRGGITT